MRQEHYGKMNSGDLVKVRGQRGNYRFRYADTFEDGREPVIWVVGGPSGHTAWRIFTAEKVRLAPAKRRNTIDQGRN